MAVRKKFFFGVAVFLLFACLPTFAKKEKVVKEKKQKTMAEKSVDQSEKKEEGEVSENAEDYWQILSWEDDRPDFVSYYEVSLEQYSRKAGDYVEIRRLKTEDNSNEIQITPLLPHGEYRYKVFTYDLIGQLSAESDWFNFNIYEAHEPRIDDISADLTGSSTLFLEEYNNGIFSVNGRNLFTLNEGAGDLSFTTYALVPEKKKRKDAEIVPEILEQSENSRKMKIRFNIKDLDTGVYNFVATDASGLSTPKNSKNQITVKYKKRVDFNIEGGYVCPVVLYDDTFQTYMGSRAWPVSVNGKAELMFIKHNWGYIGLGVAGTYTRMFSEMGKYFVDGNMITGHALFVYQLPVFFQKEGSTQRTHPFSLEVHGGPGVTYFNDYKFHFDHDVVSEPLNSLNISFAVGASAQIFVFKRLYVDVGADFIMAFTSDMPFGMVAPMVNVGWQF